ncbi:MAG: hypothetical protein LBS36_03225 [Oscillospiraceae bacterium]|jgi:hypothetical protein|nr:hypothetical protein [Oscillospiraceae bacterium]
MYSFIEELYFDNLNFQGRPIDSDSNYARAMQKSSENEEKLIEMLQGEEKRLFLDYSSACSEVWGESSCEAFVDGFRVGAHFMLDVFGCAENTFAPFMKDT